MCTTFPILAGVLLTSWAALGSWAMRPVWWNWWSAPPEDWRAVRRRLDRIGLGLWLTLFVAGLVAVTLSATAGC